MVTKLVSINSVKSNPRNPRIIKDDKFKKLVQSIQDFPKMLEIRPVVVDDAMMVLGGNMRLKAAKEAGLKEIHITMASDLTEEEKKEFIIKDNIGYGDWDTEILANDFDLEVLQGWGLDLMGDFDFSIEESQDDEEKPINENIKTDIVEGDLIEIGPHRLLCGDSCSADNIDKLMNGKVCDLIFTDPPYLLETDCGEQTKTPMAKRIKKYQGDIEFISDFNPKEFLNSAFLVFGKNEFNAYIFCNKDLLIEYLTFAKDNGLSFNVLVWKKPSGMPINHAHYPDIEYIMFIRKNAIWNKNLPDISYSRCLQYGRELGLHPTMKPVDLITNQLQISSKKGGIIVDFFNGSGSTMVAAHKTGRVCYAFEKLPKYCQVTVDRMINLNQELPLKINGEEYKPREVN